MKYKLMQINIMDSDKIRCYSFEFQKIIEEQNELGYEFVSPVHLLNGTFLIFRIRDDKVPENLTNLM